MVKNINEVSFVDKTGEALWDDFSEDPEASDEMLEILEEEALEDMDQSDSNTSSGATDDIVGDYLKLIRELDLPILTIEEEVALGKLIDCGKEAKLRLQSEEVFDEIERKALLYAIKRGERAKESFVKHNLRLVVHIAKNFISPTNQHIMMDLIQEGNIGLLTAIDKYDYTKGFKFSTYATWWVRQRISRAMIDNYGSLIRVPIHAGELYRKMVRVTDLFQKDNGRAPTDDELMEILNISPGKLELLKYVQANISLISLDTPISADGISTGDRLQDMVPMMQPHVDTVCVHDALKEEIEKVLSGCEPRTSDIFAMYYGLRGYDEHTLQEIGDKYRITRERVRQILSKAMRRFQRPGTAKHLEMFLT